MQAERSERLSSLMAAMAGGDTAAVFALRDEFGGSIRAAVLAPLRRRRATCTSEEVESLVVDVCLMLFDTASSWSPHGGALPWTWARKRIGNLVDCHLGQFAERLEDDGEELAVAGRLEGVVGRVAEPPVLEVLDRLGAAHPAARLLQEALGAVATARDGALFLELRVQSFLGDRSPAVTVGELLGLHPDAVRQQHRRVRLRLRSLVEADAKFAPLVSLELVA